MKRITIIILLCMLTSCVERVKYPIYTLNTITFVPDSLKKQHRQWITETIRGSNQHLSAGDYEDIDETIIQVERTANNLFEIEVIGLRKQIDDNNYNDLKLNPNQLNNYEIKILDSLSKI